jgi:hypothetical protein
MANRLFQQARQFVELAKEAASEGNKAEQLSTAEKAKNALSSAYANSTTAEQQQLREMTIELEQLK